MWRWDLFCAVVDNYGDIGTCWRLARQLVDEFDIHLRLFVDNLQTFAKLCPSISTDRLIQQVDGVEIHHWQADFPNIQPAEVVIEAFACAIPSQYVKAMAEQTPCPLWINLEYLTAENWIEDCHTLRSPQSNPSLQKYFFFPGFTLKTGGLLKERRLAADRAAFSSDGATHFWSEIGMPARVEGEVRISLFCYQNSALPHLLQTLSKRATPVRLFAAAGTATEQVAEWIGQPFGLGSFRQIDSLSIHGLPFLPQSDYDRLLWACDLNFVRGEDSFVRAQWAQRPFVWQIYPQADDVHLVKLDAFLKRYLSGIPYSVVVERFWLAWNRGETKLDEAWLAFDEIRQFLETHGEVWANELDRLGNLADNLVHFAREK